MTIKMLDNVEYAHAPTIPMSCIARLKNIYLNPEDSMYDYLRECTECYHYAYNLPYNLNNTMRRSRCYPLYCEVWDANSSRDVTIYAVAKIREDLRDSIYLSHVPEYTSFFNWMSAMERVCGIPHKDNLTPVKVELSSIQSRSNEYGRKLGLCVRSNTQGLRSNQF